MSRRVHDAPSVLQQRSWWPGSSRGAGPPVFKTPHEPDLASSWGAVPNLLRDKRQVGYLTSEPGLTLLGRN